MGGRKEKQKAKSKDKIVLPPQLPPEVADDDIEISDEDVDFVSKNKAYAGFVSCLDTHSITKHVSRVANADEDEVEALYERRSRKKILGAEEEKGLEVDRVNALPVKTPDGQLVYRTVPKSAKKNENADQGGADDQNEEDDGGNDGGVRLNKAERREKMKKKRREEKKQTKELAKTEKEPQNPQSEVLAEVKEDFAAAENAKTKQLRMAELGTALLEDPESNIKLLKELISLCRDKDKVTSKAALLSTLIVFRDIIPGYRIRLPTEKEQQMVLTKVQKKLRFYESTLLSSYKAFIQRLTSLLEVPEFHRVAVRCLCTLLDTHPHFNYRGSLVQPVVKYLSSSDDVVRRRCATTIQSLFTNEGKHGGEATVEVVQLISELVKIHDCQLYPDSIEVFLSLSFDEDLGRSEKADEKEKGKHKKYKGKKNSKEEVQPPISDKKKSKQELLSRTREEVNADFKAATFAQDESERKRIQTQTLAAVFNTYFRVLKNAVQPAAYLSKVNGLSSGGLLGSYPLLSPCLKGLGMFAHLIDLDFMADLLKHLKILASGSTVRNDEKSALTVSERLECCIVAFKVMRKNLDALNVDLQDFYIHLYNLIVEFRPGRDRGEVLAEALKIMLCDDRQHDMQRAAAFIKRLTTSSLCFGSAESMAGLVTVRSLLLKNVKCRYMLENDAGGGSLSGSVAKYQPYASDPHLSGALASVLWELNLLTKHYHPSVKGMAISITDISTHPNQVYKVTESPQQAYHNLVLERESFNVKYNSKTLTGKRKRGKSSPLDDTEPSLAVDEDVLKNKLCDHFSVVHDVVESEKLRRELDRATVSLQLHEEYKKRKRGK
ncbi:hypothetical protein RND81_08G172000 [Saponaria officinalis]|uniref:Nucleolar complex protein 3 homolog n=1 Tax=Saponaria officinalis TaxID=3572 RepID=A0AAW1J8W3_SAPOF